MIDIDTSTLFYHPEWQVNRVKYLIELYGEEFFNERNILELGSFNGFIGNCFRKLGAKVLSVEGRYENIHQINSSYPELNVVQSDLDVEDWKFGKWDIIINFGLIYHLEKYHKSHLVNCIKNSKLIFLESVVFDSYDSKIHFVNERGGDQSLSDRAGIPSPKFIEDILLEQKCSFSRHTTNKLNGNGHRYDWIVSNTNTFEPKSRHFWIIEN